MPTNSIGTNTRAYSTCTSWEAALGAGSQLGEMYADSDFDEAFILSDADPDGITLSVASGERHDGTANTGVRVLRTGVDPFCYMNQLTSGVPNTTLEWVEVDRNGGALADVQSGSLINLNSWNGDITVANCILHGVLNTIGWRVNGIYTTGISDHFVIRNIIYDLDTTGTQEVFGIYCNSTQNNTEIETIANNTIFGLKNNGGGGSLGRAVGLYTPDVASFTVKNNLIGGFSGTGAGTFECLDNTGPTNADYDYNFVDDTTSSGANSQDNTDIAGEFVSTTGGSEDFHLVTGADAIDQGLDLVTTPVGVNIDIDGRDVDAGDDTWDIGADEFVAAGGATLLPQMLQQGLYTGMHG